MATITHSLSSVQLKDVSEAALPADAPRERIERQVQAAHRRRSLEEKATATELPSNSPPKAACKPSRGSSRAVAALLASSNILAEAASPGPTPISLQRHSDGSRGGGGVNTAHNSRQIED